MKHTAYLINTARGGVVDQVALREALVDGRDRRRRARRHRPRAAAGRRPAADARRTCSSCRTSARPPPARARAWPTWPSTTCSPRSPGGDAAPGVVTPVAAVDIGSNSTRLLIADGAAGARARVDRHPARRGRRRERPPRRGADAARARRAGDVPRGDRGARLRARRRGDDLGRARRRQRRRVRRARERRAGLRGAHPERRRGGAADLRGRHATAATPASTSSSTSAAARPSSCSASGLPRLDADRRRPPQRAPPPHRPADAPRSSTRSRDDVRASLMAHVPVRMRGDALRAIAVAGTPTQCAAIDLGLEHYDPARDRRPRPDRVSACASCWTEWPRVPLAQRRAIRGLDPARAPVIVAGIAILLEVVDRFGLDQVEASERDILVGPRALNHIGRLKSTSKLSAHGHLFDCPRARSRWRITPVGRAVVPPAAVHRHIGPGVAASSAPPAAWTTQ